MNRINRMIRKQSTNPVNPGNPVPKPSASQLRRTSAHTDRRSLAHEIAQTPRNVPRARTAVQRHCSAIQSSSTQKSPADSDEVTVTAGQFTALQTQTLCV